jgi:hypothetical protein
MCDEDHVLLQCSKLLQLNLDDRKEVLKRSGLCLYCLKHAAEVECYGQGGWETKVRAGRMQRGARSERAQATGKGQHERESCRGRRV